MKGAYSEDIIGGPTTKLDGALSEVFVANCFVGHLSPSSPGLPFRHRLASSYLEGD
jgi:hypothetical protein